LHIGEVVERYQGAPPSFASDLRFGQFRAHFVELPQPRTQNPVLAEDDRPIQSG
jgi:hypothetical protein